jgi:methyltransferase-like protein/2-polyprenyl-3-methyl-5-hydroxy-6-metoxy-1,4-benzoquinol methylase
MSHDPSPISYENVPYHGIALSSTHPNTLASLATLFDLRPAPVERCRLLELGCATGVNLLGMAAGLPTSRFVGVDRSPHQIALAQQRAAALGLTNVSFHALDILDIDETLGEFDYIVAYGVFSWVPRDVQERIFAIYRRHLAPNGVALVSYNTYPGWHMRGMVREMMLYHSQHFADARARIDQARGLLSFLTMATEKFGAQYPDVALYSQILAQEQESLNSRPDYYLAHEHLEGVNDPIYFSAFVERAAAHQLQYLADVRFAQMLPSTLPPTIAAVIDDIAPNAIAVEQYMDFLFNRAFRQSLLVHDTVELQRALRPETMDRFLISSELQRVTDGPADGLARFRLPQRQTTISVRSPLSIAALDHLAAIWPRPIPFAELVAAAQRVAPPGDESADPVQVLRELLVRCYMIETVELGLHAPAFAVAAGERPLASPLARLLAGEEGNIPTLRHDTIQLPPVARLLLPLLDGTRDRAALLAALAEMVETGVLAQDESGPQDMARLLETTLGHLAHVSLLLA